MEATAVIVGAGHAGLAMSRRLTERSIDHVVLERGEVANSWGTERWDSLRLLTPNWMNRLPVGQPTLHGLVMAKFTNSSGLFEDFLLQVDGVDYYVKTNFYDGTRPLL